MAKKRDGCPTLFLLHIVGKRWTIPLVEILYSSRGSMQFNSIQVLLGDVSPKNLSVSLRELTDAQIIKRRESKRGGVLHTGYSLTKKGIALEGFIRNAKGLGVCIYDMDPNCINRQCNLCASLKAR